MPCSAEQQLAMAVLSGYCAMSSAPAMQSVAVLSTTLKTHIMTYSIASGMVLI